MLAGRNVTYRNLLPSALNFAAKAALELLAGMAAWAVVGNALPVVPAM